MPPNPHANTPLSAYWMPFTANRQFKAAPRMLVKAQGNFYETQDGREILDGTAGLWCCNAGHGRAEIANAVSEQLSTLDYAPSFQMGHPIAFEFAQKLAAAAPDGFEHVFFTNSGSESVETALKIALAYHQARGDHSRTRLIGRERGYHGVNFGGVSVGGLVNNRRAFGPLLGGVDHMRHTHAPQHNAFSHGVPSWGAHLADDLERIAQLHGPETIAAVIVEPVAGAAGVFIPPEGYLKRLRALCDQYGVLLIFDEVITGFGRLGSSFAAERFNVTPDLFTTAKGLTNGAAPMGAVLAQPHIHDAFMKGPENLIELFHGYTYSGHPASCAAGMAALEIYQNEKLFERAAGLADHWRDALHSLQDAPHVIDIRNLGLVGAVELAPREERPGARGYEVFVHAFENGALLRMISDTIAMSPPLTIEKHQIDRLVETLRAALKATP